MAKLVKRKRKTFHSPSHFCIVLLYNMDSHIDRLNRLITEFTYKHYPSGVTGKVSVGRLSLTSYSQL